MAIEELVTFISPPADPIENEGDWSIAETELGIVFPADFKQLIHCYGSGGFKGDLHILNPLQSWGHESIRDNLDRYREPTRCGGDPIDSASGQARVVTLRRRFKWASVLLVDRRIPG